MATYINTRRWAHVNKGAYRMRDGRGEILMLSQISWSAHIGPPGESVHIGEATTASSAAALVESALDTP